MRVAPKVGHNDVESQINLPKSDIAKKAILKPWQRNTLIIAGIAVVSFAAIWTFREPAFDLWQRLMNSDPMNSDPIKDPVKEDTGPTKIFEAIIPLKARPTDSENFVKLQKNLANDLNRIIGEADKQFESIQTCDSEMTDRTVGRAFEFEFAPENRQKDANVHSTFSMIRDKLNLKDYIGVDFCYDIREKVAGSNLLNVFIRTFKPINAQTLDQPS